MDEMFQNELEAAVFRPLVAHLCARSDAQNIDLMEVEILVPPPYVRF
jgi:hypothetical protein